MRTNIETENIQIKEMLAYMQSFISEERKVLLDNNVGQRTKYISVALENIYQAQNASAVLRTCDCFGIQDVNVIENNNDFIIDPEVVMGASKWLDIHKFQNKENNTLEAIKSLKADGYRIIATTPHTDDTMLHDFDLEKGKAVFFFGTELTGLSDVVLENADEFVKIPMYGFTESFNVSVSAALVLHHLSTQLRFSDVDWELNPKQKDQLTLDWLVRSIRSGDSILENYCTNKDMEYPSFLNKL